ncbi:hypothetical protein BpHYR1_017529 [Brachionus plicatilis]|uniref:Uncharacterized protein n=1 Tax=Brachionus plicatilis TaxID=10195 RepID=A0A3M7PED5_BRAPC|nr:hypothetical protein BpHYR1_017529 [Brachionus plicatilis]
MTKLIYNDAKEFDPMHDFYKEVGKLVKENFSRKTNRKKKLEKLLKPRLNQKQNHKQLKYFGIKKHEKMLNASRVIYIVAHNDNTIVIFKAKVKTDNLIIYTNNDLHNRIRV